VSNAEEKTSGSSPQPGWKFWHWKLHWQVLLGMLVGLGVGLLSANLGTFHGGRVDAVILDLTADLFMSALKLLVVPLIGLSMITAMTGLQEGGNLGRMGFKTIALYALTSLIAIIIGLAIVNTIAPGNQAGLSPAEIQSELATEDSQAATKLASLEAKTEGASTTDILAVFRSLIPGNIFAAAAAGNLLGVIFFCLLIGVVLRGLPASPGKASLVGACEAAYEVMMGVTHIVLRFLPVGVLALVAMTVAEAAANDTLMTYLTALVVFAGSVVLALALHAFGTLSVLLVVFGRLAPWRFFKAIAPASLTAFSTASSAATVPVTLETLENQAGLSKRIASFVIPIGATINMDGTALYEGMVVIFLAQLFGIELSIGHQFVILALALLTSIGVAGIPSASLVAIVIIIDSVNGILPDDQQIAMTALGIIFVFDRLLDMCRTAVNVTGDCAVACVVGASEGEPVLAERS
jgi:Na+/H+-dicarboxylate symporter